MAINNLKADIHCIEPIPCNPCQWACPFGAIHIGEDITNLPVVSGEKCTGCGICLGYCPGLAIRLIGPGETPGRSVVVFPYEYLPLPAPGQQVEAVDQKGQVLGTGTVQKVRRPLKGDPTELVYLDVPEDIAGQIWSMKRLVME